jgi:uncharacterized membrane protein YdbT with pleckstrin-like domain
MDLHSGEQIIFQGHPSWRSTLKFYAGGLLLAGAAGVIATLVQDSGLGIPVGIGVFVVVLIVGFLIRFATHYIVTTERLHIRRGIIARHVQETRLERVQNVNTDQSVLERVLQIGTVDFDTAGTEDSDFSFAGVAQPERVVAAVDRAQRVQTQAASAPPPPPTPPAAAAPPAPAE